MSVGIDIDLTLPRDIATVPLVRHILHSTLCELGVTDRCVSDVGVAVTEACANVVEHAAGDEEYEIRVAVDDVCCEIVIVDTIGSFLPASTDGLPPADAERGRGLLLMRALMDSMRFERRADHGTAVRLTKDLEFDHRPLHPR